MGSDEIGPEHIEQADIIKFWHETTIFPRGASYFGSPPCIAFSTTWNPAGFTDGDLEVEYGSYTYEDMYSLAGHELLHCFGMRHPVDMEPEEDIMSYEAWPRPELRCPSNLNVWAAAGAFASETHLPEEVAKVSHDEYEQYCNPENDPRDGG